MTKYISGSNMPRGIIQATAIVTLLLVILFALGILGADKKIEPGNTLKNHFDLSSGVQTLRIGKQTAGNEQSWQGVVKSRWTVKIAPKLNARIVEVLVHPGDKVKKGEVIARLDDRDLVAAYNAATASYMAAQAHAEQTHAEEKRIIDLYTKQAATKQNYDAVIAQSKASRAMANQASSVAQQAKVMLGENILYAPFAGIIGERLQEPGDMGLANQPVVTLHNPDDLRLEVALASHCAASIKWGMEVNVGFDTLHTPVIGKIDEIAPEIDPQTHTQTIKIKLPKMEGLQQGQFGWLMLGCEAEQQALMIPASAILHYGQLQAVKVIDGQQLTTRHIRTGKQYGSQIELLSGLHEGETILIQGVSLP